MKKFRPRFWYVALSLTVLSVGAGSCGETAKLKISDGIGPNPMLPPPNKTFIPTVNIAEATGWGPNGAPTPAAGFAVNAFARGLDHPRWLAVLPNGDVLVAETNAPPKPKDKSGGIKGFIMKSMMKKAGAGVPSANRITLLRDTNGDGVADKRSVFLKGLTSPFGMALIGQTFYVANADALMRFPYVDGATSIAAAGTKVVDLPAGRNHHWTKSLLASADGSRLYVGVGSNSNVADHGMGEEVERAAIWEIDPATGAHRVFASGLRNPVGIAWQPQSGALWTSVNERDEIGSDLVPDYMTSVRDGGFYGWPFSYYGQHVDVRVKPPRPDLVATAIKPDYALGAHTGSLGLAFYTGNAWPARYVGGAIVGQHGSWNRDPPSGYRVIFVPFSGGVPNGAPEELLTGFRVGD
ncbi:MAG: sorbosone dehydrogenase family protein, partial [Lysobacterales bacterium]